MAYPDPLCVKVRDDLYHSARRAAGLPETASQGQVVRWALAVVAGRDPATEAFRTQGKTDTRPKGRPRGRKQVQT